MRKYDSVRTFLASEPAGARPVVLGNRADHRHMLPSTARHHRAWWSNHRSNDAPTRSGLQPVSAEPVDLLGASSLFAAVAVDLTGTADPSSDHRT
jgi:hypothetical protein